MLISHHIQRSRMNAIANRIRSSLILVSKVVTWVLLMLGLRKGELKCFVYC